MPERCSLAQNAEVHAAQIWSYGKTPVSTKKGTPRTIQKGDHISTSLRTIIYDTTENQNGTSRKPPKRPINISRGTFSKWETNIQAHRPNTPLQNEGRAEMQLKELIQKLMRQWYNKWPAPQPESKSSRQWKWTEQAVKSAKFSRKPNNQVIRSHDEESGTGHSNKDVIESRQTQVQARTGKLQENTSHKNELPGGHNQYWRAPEVKQETWPGELNQREPTKHMETEKDRGYVLKKFNYCLARYSGKASNRFHSRPNQQKLARKTNVLRKVPKKHHC